MSIESEKVHSRVVVLYTTASLRKAIRDVLKEPHRGDRRVAFVAFVGREAQDFLPDPGRLEIVCSLQPGATDPLTLGRLKKRGAILFQSSKLHMKVYWSSRNGCVICSANASNNALGGGGLIEAGVKLPAGAVDVDRLWKAAKPEPIASKDLKNLANKTPARRPLGSRVLKAKAPTFLEWTETEGVTDWKLAWWDAPGDWAKIAKQTARKSYGIVDPHDYYYCAKGQAGPGEWLLSFDVQAPLKAEWFNTDFVVKVPKEEEEVYNVHHPYAAVMLHPLQKYEPPPFELDKPFAAAFRSALRRFGRDKLQGLGDLTPTQELINLIKEAVLAGE